jgi:hypothetical protein
MAKIHLTITGFAHFYGALPFEEGQIIYLKKEPENSFDAEAVAAHLPYLGKIGYVANTPTTVVRGTVSGGRLYDRFQTDAVARVEFITETQIICRLLSSSKARKYLDMYDIFENELRLLDSQTSEGAGVPLMIHIFDVSKGKTIDITPLWER